MPELPEITIFWRHFVVRRTMLDAVIRCPFLPRAFDPEIGGSRGQTVKFVSRIGKQIEWEPSGDLWMVFHLMITGRFHWRKPGTKPSRKVDLAAFSFENGIPLLTKAGSKKRASIHLHRGSESLEMHARRGLDVFDCTVEEFQVRLQRQNRTLKKALVDPWLFDGIGNTCSDEILHVAKLSPMEWTQ